jgi:nitrite reductase/ring-hydroxylating ferredoxin subunit
VGDRTLAVFKVQGMYYSLANACPHKGGPLGQGTLCGHVVTCPWHGWTWDVRTGVNARIPSVRPVECYPVKVVDGQLYIELPAPAASAPPHAAESDANQGPVPKGA